MIQKGESPKLETNRFFQIKTENTTVSLFLMSTAAFGIGINLTAANRCIIYDSPWNPGLLNQAISRIYRLGQERKCFIYRFVGQGCMEEQIYENAVLKESLSLSVIDKYQIKRHFNKLSKNKLYKFDYKRYEPNKRVTNKYVKIKDTVMKDLLKNTACRFSQSRRFFIKLRGGVK